MLKICNRQAATPIILIFAVISLGWYLVMLVNPENIGHPVAYGLLLFAEALGMGQLLGVWLTIIVGKPEGIRYDVLASKHALLKNPKLGGKIAVLVPVAGEPLPVITRTLIAARDMRLPHETYVLDDGMSDDVKALAQSLDIRYLRRADRTGWKAGNINHALSKVQSDYFVIFDSDHVAKPEFLEETLPWLLADPQLAFVQTPQHLINTNSYVSEGISESQEVFYRHIQTGKNTFNAAFCVGTNVIFRTQAIREVGGLHEDTPCEDLWTSVLLHEQGWKSMYLPIVLATGEAPETVDAYFRQQYRWATGGYELLFKRNPLFSRKLSVDQRLQYFHTAMFFMSGFSVFIFYLLPLMYVYFGWKPLAISGGAATWIGHTVPYIVLMYFSMAHLMGRWPKWRTFVIATGAFQAHIAACISVLTGLKLRWSASGVIRSNIDYVKAIMMHLLFLLLSVAAIPILLLRPQNYVLTVLMMAWLCWNSILLFSFCRRALPSRSARQESVSAPAFA